MSTDREMHWPALPYEAWKDTYATLHLWMQVVGKIALACAPPLNHCWAIALHVTARGLATRTLPFASRAFVIDFDFIDHELAVRTTDGDQRVLPLRAQTVADFHRMLIGAMHELGLPVTIWPVAVELPLPIRLDRDTRHRSYDAGYANRFWRILVQVERVFTESQCAFVGKSSPVHFFWGSFDLAVTRFSGRLAPPREGPAFVRDAYSHEVISHGFWPGSGSVLEPAFYAYAVPEPSAFTDADVAPAAARYQRDLGEFILPYAAVRRSASPDHEIRAFIESTYARAADLGAWPRSTLERARRASPDSS